MTSVVATKPDAWERLQDSLHPLARPLAGDGLEFRFSGLQRPECVLTHSSGDVYTSDRRGGVLKIHPDGSQSLSCNSSLLPNGIAMQADGGFLVANLGEQGGVWQIATDGTQAPWLTEVEGRALDRVNFVLNDHFGRVWSCISATDGGDHYPLHTATGYIVLRDAIGTRVVADGLHYTNECRVSLDGRYLYVNETFGRRLSRFGVGPSGELTGKEILSRFGDGDFPDGLTLDAEGGAWVVCVGSNRLYRVAPDGERITVIDDAVVETTAQLEAAFVAGTLNRPQLSAARGRRLSNVTCLAFGGADLRTAYLGCLAGDSLACFRSPVPGIQPVHWNWP